MRIQKLLQTMQQCGADAALVTASENVAYYSSFSGTSSQLLITPEQRYFFTDFRYAEQAAKETDFSVVETKGHQRIETLFEYIKRHNVKKVGIDLSDVSYRAYKNYQQHISDKNIIDISAHIALQRAVKDETELELIAKGAQRNDLLFRHLCGLIREGVSEMDIKAEIVYYMHKNGAESAFAPIVASGENASLPHATPTDRKLCAGDLLTMDYGCRFGGYCSDFTRTVAISFMDKEQQKVYDIVNRAGKLGIEALRPGIRACDVDAVARGFIAKSGYAQYFGHGLGHGVGRFIHEVPSIGESSDAVLEAGMVVTIEPGIYLQGRFGVRIEDLIVIKDGGCENLTSAPREVIII